MKRTSMVIALGFLLGPGLLSWGQPTLHSAELRGRNGARSNHRLVSQAEEMPAEEVETIPERVKPQPKASKPARSYYTPSKAPSQMLENYGWEGEGDVMPHHSSGGTMLDDMCADGSCGSRYKPHCRTWWGSAEFLLLWRKERNTPSLVTTATAVVDEDTDGQIGETNTRILLGNDSFDPHLQPGGRFDIGFWSDDCQTCGFGGRFTGLGDDDVNYRVDNTTNNVLTIPFFNLDAAVNEEDTLIVAHPNTGATGNINVIGHNEVYTTDLYIRRLLLKECDYRIDFIGGYFFSRINDDLEINSTTLVGNTVNIRDTFRAKNEYHGGSLGLMGEFDRECFRVNILAKVALTNVNQTVIIDGQQNIDNGAQVVNNGLFAQPSNIGTRDRSEFSAVPEFGFNYAYKVGCGVELTTGYTLIYWDNVVRAGDQIDRSVDNTQRVARPEFNFVESDYWAHGMNFGLNWVY